MSVQFTFTWDKKLNDTSTHVATVGALACYKFNDSWEFTREWIRPYPVQTGSLHWSPLEHTLYVGFDDGNIERLKITENSLATDVSLK